MIEQYHREVTPLVYEGKKWRSLVPPGVRETDFTWEFPSYYDYHARGAVYYGLITSIKNYGPQPGLYDESFELNHIELLK